MAQVSEYIAYMTFITILLVGILYLYWLDETETQSEEEEGGLGLNWIPFHKLIDDTEKKDKSFNSENSTNMDVHDGDWLCKVDHSGKEIELVKPIEHYVSSGGSQFASLYN